MEYDSEGKSFYDGDWVNNVKHGWGTRQYPTGNAYQGMWFNNVRHGEGTMKWHDKNQIYTGNWENGIQVCFPDIIIDYLPKISRFCYLHLCCSPVAYFWMQLMKFLSKF